MLPIRFAGTLTCHSVPVSKELETARGTAAMIVTVTTPLADVKWSPLPLPEVHVDAHTKERGPAVDTQQLVRTRLHDTALNQTPVLSRVCKEEEIAVDMMCATAIIIREVVLSSNKPDPTLPVVAVTRELGLVEERWCPVSIKIPIVVEVRINRYRAA